jgi:hypothetical protein
MTRRPEEITPGNPNDGFRFFDAHVYAAYLDAIPQDTGNVEITVGMEATDESEGDGYFIDLKAEDREHLAEILAGETTPGLNRNATARNTGKFNIVVDTAMFNATPEGTDRLLQRIAWHIRNGIPGLITEPDGGQASVNEVSDGEVPVRMKEVRRHFRYKTPGSNEWHYHSSFRTAQDQQGRNIQFQRTYKSDWEDL